MSSGVPNTNILGLLQTTTHREVNRLLVAVILATYCVFLPTQPSRQEERHNEWELVLDREDDINERMLHLKSK